MKSFLIPICTMIINFSIAQSALDVSSLSFGRVNRKVDSLTQKGWIDKTPSHYIALSEGIYPNYQNFELGIPRIFAKDEGAFRRKVSYYYTKSDSIVKVILYSWEAPEAPQGGFFDDKSIKAEKFRNFKQQWNELADSLTHRLGKPDVEEIASKKYGDKVLDMPSLEEIRANGDRVKKEDTSWRDDMKWINHGELNAYLFMFGDNRTGFREIRLALYKE